MSITRIVQKGEIYRHFKGNLYQIVSVATHSETNEQYVVYQALYGDMQVWVRPYASFVSEVDRTKYPQAMQTYRFEAVSTLAGGVVQAVQQAPVQMVQQEWSKDVQPQGGTLQQSDISRTETSYSEDEPAVDERLLAFLDTDTYKEKLNYLSFIKSNIDDRLINDIAVALDIMIDEGPIDERYSSLVSCLQTMAKFECNRLR